MRHLASSLGVSLLIIWLGSGGVYGIDGKFPREPASAHPDSIEVLQSMDNQEALQGAIQAAGDVAVRSTDLEWRVQQRWISAIGNDRIDTLRQMLARHQPSQLLRLTASNGKNALMVASKKGDLSLVKSLIDSGADILARTETNGTAFMFAVLGNRRQVAEWLLAKGADIQVVGSNGWTALTLAAAKGYTDLLQWLIDMGAQTQVRDVYRFTPFMRAVENGQESVARVLADLPNTDINAQDEYGNTSLHHAVSARDIAMVRLLMQYGADTEIDNRDGATPAMLAADSPAIQLLLR